MTPMKKLEQLNDELIWMLCQIEHPWNKICYLSDKDLEEIGKYPDLKKTYPIHSFEAINYPKLEELIFQRLIFAEPLFFKVSEEFKSLIKESIGVACLNVNSEKKGYTNRFSWALVYFHIRGTHPIVNFHPEDHPVDFEVWKKTEMSDFVRSERDRILGKQHKIDYANVFNDDGVYCKKIIDSVSKNYKRSS